MFTEHRNQVLETMEENSVAIVYAGEEIHTNEDEYYPFTVNSQFFWMTGLQRAGMILMLSRIGGEKKATLFIDAYDPTTVRWTGKMPTKEEVQTISGVTDVRYTSEFDMAVNRALARSDVRHAYFDVHKNSRKDIPTYNEVKAAEFVRDYPAVQLHDLHAVAAPLRNIKNAGEIERIRKAIDITRRGLEAVMEQLRPGKTEYQVQADFEYKCRYVGADYRMAFTTIAGGGPNACMMHYVENERALEDGEMILLDLGAQYQNYCSDITRVYPANGKFSPRQREYYELVLKANKAVVAAAKPGVTMKELNDIVNKVLGEGLMAMGKIDRMEDVKKYYMHGCGHSMGVDVHDINLDANAVLAPGWVITDEPGLYIDEEAIGIRIEDDLLITEDGCEVLSKDIIREVDDIEKFMAEHGDHRA